MDIRHKLMELVMLPGCAFVLGSAAQKSRQSPVPGYILAGEDTSLDADGESVYAVILELSGRVSLARADLIQSAKMRMPRTVSLAAGMEK